MFPEASAPSADAGIQSSSDLLDSVFEDSAPQDTADPQGEADGAEGEQQLAEAPDSFDQDLFDEDPEPEQVDDNGRNAYKMSEARMQRFQQAKKLADGIQAFAPSIEAAKSHYERANDFNTMESDFRSPNEMVQVPGPNGQMREVPAARAWLEHWNSVSPDGVGAVAEMIPQFLFQTGNTRALARVEAVVDRAKVEGFYQRASQSGDPEDLVKAQNLDYILNGKFRDKIDPAQRRDASQDQLRQREQLVADRESRHVQNEWRNFNSQHLDGARDRAFGSQMDQLFNLPKVKASGFSPTILSALRSDITAQVKAAIAQDAEWSRNEGTKRRDIQTAYTTAVREGKATNLAPYAKQVVDEYSAQVRRTLIAVARPIFAKATQDVVNANRAGHSKLQASSARSAPAGGAPVRRSIVAQPKGRTSMDLLDSVLDN